MDLEAIEMTKLKSALWSPAGLTLLFSALVVSWVIFSADGDPLALARIGTQYSQADPDGTQGYDGQFVYYIAQDLNPATVAEYLDSPAYRYQRILLPLLGRIFSAGNLLALPWVLGLIGLLSHAAGTWLVSKLLVDLGVSRWYGLVYGLWVGFVLAVRLDLPEPLAYGLVAGAIYAIRKDKKQLGWIFYGLALFAKEVTILFLAAQWLYYILSKRWRDLAGFFLVGLFPYLIFQGWLWTTFGQPGIGSGGAMATPFELIPFMGLISVADFSSEYFIALAIVYSPFIIFPALWGIWSSLAKWIGSKQVEVINFGLLLNALIIPFIPFSTFREPGGMLRFSSGLVLAILLYSGKHNIKRALNYSVFWIVLNVILLNEFIG